jgi:hypothetical protein
MVFVTEKVILQLPSEVAGSILTRNLTLRDISRLDIACCACEERTLYFEALRASGGVSEVVAANSAVGWVIKRNLKVGKLKVQSANAVECLATVAASHQLFATIELLAASWTQELPMLQTALVILSEIEDKVSFFSFRSLSKGDPPSRGPSFRNLLTFTVDCYGEMSGWAVDVLYQNCFLKRVRLVAREPLSASVFAALLARRSTLTHFTLLVTDELNDALFGQVAGSCPGLLNLEIGDLGTGFTPAVSQGVVSLAQSCPGLRELKVYNGMLSDDAANQALLRGLRNLCVLDVLGANMLLSDALLQTLAECLSDAPFLTDLEIVWNVQRTDTVTQASVVLNNLRRLMLFSAYPPPPVGALLTGLAQLSRLEDLTLKVLGLPTSKLVSAVAQGSPNLRSISVDCGWQESAEAGLIEVAQYCPLLEKVHSDRGTISDALLQALAQHCPGFRALSNVGGRSTVTAAGLLALVQGCPLLATLDLCAEAALDDTVLHALSQHSYYLEKLRLSEVTVESVVQLVASCKYLNTLWCGDADLSPDMEQRLLQMSRARGRKLNIIR